MGHSELVCGLNPACIPNSVSGEQREAAQMYLHFVLSQCGGAASTQSATNASSHVATQAGQQAEPDPESSSLHHS